MPHAVSAPSPGLQALVLCGPGSSFPTFTSDPDKHPKALLPIANRPMVWYPLNFLYDMGITDITLVCPASSKEAITQAFQRDPCLTTALPLPKPTLLFPEDLEQTTGTAEILRLPAIREAITSDFVVLPCDLICEVPGEKLLQAWMVKAASLSEILGAPSSTGTLREASGGFAVFYETKTALAVKKEETDFIATTPLPATPIAPQKGSLLPQLSNLVYSMPKDSLRDVMLDKNGLPLRHGLLRAHPRVRMLTTYRDAHLYIFPKWILDFINDNEPLESISEDVIGWWAKAGWQAGLGEKLGLRKILQAPEDEQEDAASVERTPSPQEDPTDAASTSHLTTKRRLSNAGGSHAGNIPGNDGAAEVEALQVPPILAYVHPTGDTAPLIRRVDTAEMLLNVSLHLAKLAPVEEAGSEASPLAHARKVSYPEGVKPRTTITKQDSLVGNNVLVEEKVAIKETVVGNNCHIHEGAKLHQCLLMDGVRVGKHCKLTKCILGPHSVIEDGTVLTNCQVQENYRVEAKTEEKDHKFMSSAGLEADDDEAEGVLQDMDDEVQAFNETAIVE
ncbi:translation initiation factor eIF2B [Plectosphaerella cucumerina]|uniref:Translation initiation factor eIF2B subunit gamma n=1 Tax=Plectosphaerella cucumerina TaxID=40658 RepID=A0A8K0WY00_9PEZI|nr:translation initiation factor eIF2B [Plectosphaerella cucumerina]